MNKLEILEKITFACLVYALIIVINALSYTIAPRLTSLLFLLSILGSFVWMTILLVKKLQK